MHLILRMYTHAHFHFITTHLICFTKNSPPWSFISFIDPSYEWSMFFITLFSTFLSHPISINHLSIGISLFIEKPIVVHLTSPACSSIFPRSIWQTFLPASLFFWALSNDVFFFHFVSLAISFFQLFISIPLSTHPKSSQTWSIYKKSSLPPLQNHYNHLSLSQNVKKWDATTSSFLSSKLYIIPYSRPLHLSPCIHPIPSSCLQCFQFYILRKISSYHFWCLWLLLFN